MITWGISANSHDAAVAVFENGQLQFASHSERFSKKKNDPDLCHELLNYAAYQCGYPNEVVWYEKPWAKTARQFYAGQGLDHRSNDIKKYLSSYGVKAPITTMWHHESHAAAGFYTSNFAQAAVVVIDAIGEFETLTIWQGSEQGLKQIYQQRYPHSLGLWYSAMTQRCYLKPNEEEYILMGMAAYGDPAKLKDRIRQDFFNNNSNKLISFKQNLHRGCQDWAPELTVNDTFDIAAATQAVYEEYFEKIVAHAKRITGLDNLVIMGGCALNCMANPIAYRHFKNIWIMPNPGDAGSAIGAVLARNKQHIAWSGCDLGYDIEANSTVEEIVSYLEQHKICGVAQGRAEFGPRALGNRSLLADPRGASIKHTVNAIKQRQQFRPFAPVVLEELAEDYFDLPGPAHDNRYMQFVSPCRHPELFPAVVHRDNTSRVQTVPADGTRIRAILELWYQRTGCAMLLNTSLNIKGQPMVNDTADAEAFERHYGVQVFR